MKRIEKEEQQRILWKLYDKLNENYTRNSEIIPFKKRDLCSAVSIYMIGIRVLQNIGRFFPQRIKPKVKRAMKIK